MNESWYLKCINAMNPVMHYGNKIVPMDQKDEFYRKWKELRDMIASWNK